MSVQPQPGHDRGHLSAVPDQAGDDEGAPVAPATSSDEVTIDDRDTAGYVLFDGDQGGLEIAERKAFVALLKQRFISSETHPKEWAALLDNVAAITSRLNDCFFTLHLDREREVAWKVQARPEGGGRFPTLGYTTTYNREATIALCYLRDRQRGDAAAGVPTTFVDREDILEHLDSMRPASDTDDVAHAKRANRAVDELYSAGLLIGRKTADRFQVARAIEALMSLTQLRELLTQIAADPAQQPAGDTDDGVGHDEDDVDEDQVTDPGEHQ